ncbi:DNA polymerase V subunit UmuC, partial [Acinetobacter baumannii]|nr:DNA polymerase V subunit UmuC [Acinetobacter baumannii]
MEKKVFALADINNAYCSCERVFNPKLIGKPLIILSNNDGCAISRSDEAKSIGIKMGVPLFKIKDLVKEHNVQVLSSNFPVYAEMSRRFMNVLAEFVGDKETEVYSIDECFLDLTAYQKNFNLTDYARTMKDQVYQYLGLPICIGIGRTKTEAKLANFIAKKNKHFNGICNLLDIDLTNLEAIYQSIPVEEVWGIGSQHAKKLHAMG